MGETQLKELGYRLTGLAIYFNSEERTALYWGCPRQYININYLELGNCIYELQDRGFNKLYLTLQTLLHEIAHYKQYLKYGKGEADIYASWMFGNGNKAERVADRYALMYYKRFV